MYKWYEKVKKCLLKFNFGIGNLFKLKSGKNCINSCKNPASKTPHAKTKIGISYFGAIRRAAIIKHKLNNIGVNAGRENLACEFWIPPAKATNEIRAKYGNIILSTSTDKSFLIGSK